MKISIRALTSFARTWHGKAAIVLSIVLVALAAVGAINYFNRGYQPTKAEAQMFAHLTPATGVQQTDASNALGGLHYDWNSPGTYDVYVAHGSFKTVYTAHPMVIMMSRGTKWLGGSLGQITLVMQLTPSEIANTNKAPNVQSAIRNWDYANTLYDPLCLAYDFGYATKQSCESTPAQRERVTISQQVLTPLASKRADALNQLAQFQYFGSGAVGLMNDWTTPAGRATAFVPAPDSNQRPDGTTRFPMTYLHRGQVITGGVLGMREVVLPITYRTYAGDRQYRVIDDPVVFSCNPTDGIKAYLGPVPLKMYAPYCSN